MYGFDVFEDSKRNQFNKSIDVIKTLSKYFDSVLSEEDLSVSAQKRKYFDEFLQVTFPAIMLYLGLKRSLSKIDRLDQYHSSLICL